MKIYIVQTKFPIALDRNKHVALYIITVTLLTFSLLLLLCSQSRILRTLQSVTKQTIPTPHSCNQTGCFLKQARVAAKITIS